MALRVALVYNDPIPDRYSQMGEAAAVADVLDAVKAVNDALVGMGHSVTKVPLVPPIDEVRAILSSLEVDIFFNLFEGFAGQPETEAMVAGMMAVLGKPFTGSAAPTLALALDKAKTKELLIAAGLATPRYQVLRPESVNSFTLSYPCIVKPVAEDASHGVNQDSVVHNSLSLAQQVAKICTDYGGRALVEEFLDGRQLSVTIIGNRKPTVFFISEIVFSLPPELPRIFTFGAKWLTSDVYYDRTTPVCPAKVDEDLRAHLAGMSIATYKLLGCRGYARVDLRLDAHGCANVLEVNPNPDIAIPSWSEEGSGVPYPKIVERIIELAFDKE
ncbi:MAG: ATP-grasp domain-containing protein [Dehalococcoidales bacterium]